MSELGVSTADFATALGTLVSGLKATDYNEAGEQYEVHVRAGPTSAIGSTPWNWFPCRR